MDGDPPSSSLGEVGAREFYTPCARLNAFSPIRWRIDPQWVLPGVADIRRLADGWFVVRVFADQDGVTRTVDSNRCESSWRSRRLSEATRKAYAIIEKNGQQARGLASLLLETEYRSDLPDDEREAIVDRWIADRRERQHQFLEGLGLVRDTAKPYQYGPGTWSLTAEREEHGYIFVISGIRAPSGAEVSIRLTAKECHSAALAWKAIARAIGPEKVLKPSAAEWRRFWVGFDYSIRRRKRRTALGIWIVMHREMVKRLGEQR